MVSKNYRFSEAESKPQENKTFWIPHELEHLIISKIFYRTPMKSNNDRYKTKRVSINKIFTTHKSFNNLKIGEGYAYPTPKVSNFKEEDIKVFTIKAFGIKSLLLIDKNNRVIEAKYP